LENLKIKFSLIYDFEYQISAILKRPKAINITNMHIPRLRKTALLLLLGNISFKDTSNEIDLFNLFVGNQAFYSKGST